MDLPQSLLLFRLKASLKLISHVPAHQSVSNLKVQSGLRQYVRSAVTALPKDQVDYAPDFR